MRKLIIIICTAIKCISLSVQAELALNKAFDHIASEPPNDTTASFRPVLKSDSTSWNVASKSFLGIHMYLYYSLKHPDSLHADLYSQAGSYHEYAGKIWEDTISGKLWYFLYEEERLIMDLSLDVGDTFEFWEGYTGTVDSVYFLDDGRKVVSIDLPTGFEENIRFIEGVGPNASLMWSGLSNTYLTCKYDNDELVFVTSNSMFDGCLPLDTGLDPELRNGSKIRLYPNPASDVLHVDIDPSLLPATEIIIYNIRGVALKHLHLQGYQHTINLGDLNKGLYFVSINNGPHRLRHKIVIK